MHYFHVLAAALTVGVSLLYRCRFQRVDTDPKAAALMRDRGQPFAQRHDAGCWYGTPGQQRQHGRHNA